MPGCGGGGRGCAGSLQGDGRCSCSTAAVSCYVAQPAALDCGAGLQWCTPAPCAGRSISPPHRRRRRRHPLLPPQELGLLARGLTRLDLALDSRSRRRQAPTQELCAALSPLTALRSLELSACLANPLPPAALSSLAGLTSLSVQVPLTWGSGGLLRLAGEHLGGCSALRRLTLSRVALALLSPEAQRAWQRLEALCLLDVELPAASAEGVLGALPTLGSLAGATVLWGAAACDPAVVRSSLSRCTHLRSLDLRMYRLSSLPELHPVLTSLSLEFAYLTSPPPPQALRSLLSLQLSYCPQLVAWLGELHCLTQLRRLTVSNCSLADFPPALAGLVRLREISLPNNQLTALPAGSYLGGLERLCLRSNLLEEVPPVLASALALTSLDLSCNAGLRLAGGGMEALRPLSNMQHLDLRGTCGAAPGAPGAWGCGFVAGPAPPRVAAF